MNVDGLKSDDEKNSKRISVTISEKKPCNRVAMFRRVSNPGPLACEASVITTTLRNRTLNEQKKVSPHRVCYRIY